MYYVTSLLRSPPSKQKIVFKAPCLIPLPSVLVQPVGLLDSSSVTPARGRLIFFLRLELIFALCLCCSPLPSLLPPHYHYLFMYLFIYVGGAHVSRSEDNLWKPIFLPCGFWGSMQVIRCGLAFICWAILSPQILLSYRGCPFLSLSLLFYFLFIYFL